MQQKSSIHNGIVTCRRIFANKPVRLQLKVLIHFTQHPPPFFHSPSRLQLSLLALIVDEALSGWDERPTFQQEAIVSSSSSGGGWETAQRERTFTCLQSDVAAHCLSRHFSLYYVLCFPHSTAAQTASRAEKSSARRVLKGASFAARQLNWKGMMITIRCSVFADDRIESTGPIAENFQSLFYWKILCRKQLTIDNNILSFGTH